MSVTPQDILLDVSPDRGPFTFHAWLELPFPFPMTVKQTFPVMYRESLEVQLDLEIHSPSYKVVTGNTWIHNRDFHKWLEVYRSGHENDTPPQPSLDHEYAKEGEIGDVVEKLEEKDPSYIHVEDVPSVVHLIAPVPDSVVPEDNFQPFSLKPISGFFRKQILPKLQDIIEIYRIAALPYMRYSILPISEALIDTIFMRFTDSDGVILQNIHYGFDPVGSPMHLHIPRPGVEDRFTELVSQTNAFDPEIHFSSCYYLFRMRRWSEAIAIASSATEYLQQELIFDIASTEIESQALSRCYRYKELFNKVFPEFGLQKLSDEDPKLWQDFVEAKKYRGFSMHGYATGSYNNQEKEDVKRYLSAFYRVSSWLSKQLNRPWNLDFVHEGKILDPFP